MKWFLFPNVILFLSFPIFCCIFHNILLFPLCPYFPILIIVQIFQTSCFPKFRIFSFSIFSLLLSMHKFLFLAKYSLYSLFPLYSLSLLSLIFHYYQFVCIPLITYFPFILFIFKYSTFPLNPLNPIFSLYSLFLLFSLK